MGCLLWLFTGLLSVLLLIQIPLVALLCLGKEWSLPTGWIERSVNSGSDHPFKIAIESASLGKDGTLSLSGVSLHNSMGRKVAHAENLSADFYLPTLLYADFTPEQIQARNIEVYDSTGPLGVKRELFLFEALDLRRSEGSWKVNDARIRCGSLAISLAGDLPRVQARRADPVLDIEKKLQEGIRWVKEVRDHLQRLKSPYLQVFFEESPAGDPSIRASLSADRANLPFDLRLEGDVRAGFRASIAEERIQPKLIEFSADRLIYREDLTVENPYLQSSPPAGFSGTNLLSGITLRATASSLSNGLIRVDTPTFAAAMGRFFEVDFQGQAGIFGEPVTINASIAPLRGSGTLKTKGLLAVNQALDFLNLPDDLSQVQLDFPQGVYLSTSTEFKDSKWIPDQIQYRAEGEAFDIQGFTGIRGQAEGFIRPRERIVEVDDLLVEKADHFLAGSYWQDFNSNEFGFRMKGGFRPMDLAGWMKPWWDEIWVDFEINETPFVNLAIVGDWDNSDDRKIFGGFRFQNISYKGTQIDRGYSSFRSRPYLFELFNLKAFRQEGEASGSLAILLDGRTREVRVNLYDFESSFHFKKISPLFGEALAPTFAKFELSGPPALIIEGAIYYPEREDTSPETVLTIEATTDEALTYRDIQMDSLSLTADFSKNVLRLDPIRFDLGGGTGAGWVVQRPEGSAQGETSIQLEFTNGNPSKVVDAVPMLTEVLRDRIDEESDPDPEVSRLDFFIECSGDLDQPETLLGEGSINLLSENLANIRLLGILSRISEELPLPITLGSFQFERLSTSFLLNRGLVEFPDLTLYSPSSKLLASGAYEMEPQTIDFNARVLLMGQVKFPILAQIGALLNPVGKVFEVRIWGKLDDPKWRLYLDPRSW